jgi:hypothetical protein
MCCVSNTESPKPLATKERKELKAMPRSGLTTKLTDSHERRRTPGIDKDAKPGAHGCSV